MSLLSLSALGKRYREGGSYRQVIHDLDFSLDRGECVALLGESGSGKSTLLNLISGIDLPDSGTVSVEGRVLSSLAEPQRSHWRRRHLGFVFQFFNLLPTLTALENVRLPLALNAMDDPPRRAEAQTLLAQIGLGGREHSFPEQLSGGEQQRLAIVRALVHGPRLLLADEPTGNLDSVTGAEVIELLLRMTGKRGTSVLMVTHSETLAGRADRQMRLRGGRLEPAV